MTGKIVPPRSTATFSVVEGDLDVKRQAVVKGEGSPPKVVVAGTIHAEDDSIFDCSLSGDELDAKGRIIVKGDLEIRNGVIVDEGSLTVLGSMTAKKADVSRNLRVEKTLDVEEVDVGGHLEVGGSTVANDIDVCGMFKADGKVKAKNIDVCGSVKVWADIDVEDNVDVGGTIVVEGGKVNKVDVGGSFISKKPLSFCRIDVGGSVKLAGGSVGGSIEVGGICKVAGDLKFDAIDVGGVIKIEGSAEGAEIDVGGKIHTEGALTLSGALEVGGKADIEGELSAQKVEVGGSLRAPKVTVHSTVTVGGFIDTKEGVHASVVRIGTRGKVRGPIKADEVFVGRRAYVEDIEAKRIVLHRNARARNLRGEEIELESGCRISGKIYYTTRLDTDRNIRFTEPPEKVE